ncbi:MAG: DNA repair protein RecO [Ruminococcus sp.]|uniref:DNA repair protein RecO n=1 Tax=Ruminococcus sp. TaxID=41978 RepID=UPI0025F4BDC2|nr:DNA repair protein RecO [Ruminococcus sp.]MCR5600048.1 DNA repair protein RecO [Ruminococcus sp.]
MTTVEGIVLKERSVGEQDKFIDILTKESGVLEISVKGAKKINGRSGSSTQLLAYSRFCIDKRGSYLYLNSAEPIHIFYGLRDSLAKISLASYFAEVMRSCIKPEAQNGDIMRLLLNCLHYLETGERDEKLLKAVFELRLMSEIGYMPDIVACRSCGAFEPEELYFCMESGGFYCSDCFENESEQNYMKIKLPVLSAVRHIVLADFSRLFNFRVSDGTQQQLSELAEQYLLIHLERGFGTLDFYKTL